MKEQIFYIISCLVLAQETLIKGVFPRFNRERDNTIPHLDVEDWWNSVTDLLSSCKEYLSQPEISDLEEYFSDIKEYSKDPEGTSLEEFENYIQNKRPACLMCATLLTPNAVMRDPHWNAAEIRGALAKSLNPDHHQFIEELVEFSRTPLQLNIAWRGAMEAYGERSEEKFPDMGTEEKENKSELVP